MATTDIAGWTSSDHLQVLSSGPLLRLFPGFVEVSMRCVLEVIVVGDVAQHPGDCA